MQSNNRLLVDSVHLEFDRLQVLQSAFITAQTGRVTGVLGRNGCGKSCLFKSIMGGIKPQNIFIRFNDKPETDYGHIGERVKYLPQNTFIPPKMTLEEAFDIYGVDYDGLVGFDPKFHTMQRRQVRELSGGEVRIAEMYLILNSEAELCILDEPFSNVAPKHVEKMQELTKAELEIMQLIWQKEKVLVHDILAEMPEPKPAYNTVSTIVRILENKGL